MTRFALPLLLSSLAIPAWAFDDLVAQTVLQAAQTRTVARAANNLRSVTATYVGEVDGCSRISVNEGRYQQHFDVCNGHIQEIREVAPAAPDDDPHYRSTVVWVGQQALLHGASSARFEGYALQATRLGLPTLAGCAVVDIMVSYDGLLVDNQQPKVCP